MGLKQLPTSVFDCDEAGPIPRGHLAKNRCYQRDFARTTVATALATWSVQLCVETTTVRARFLLRVDVDAQADALPACVWRRVAHRAIDCRQRV